LPLCSSCGAAAAHRAMRGAVAASAGPALAQSIAVLGFPKKKEGATVQFFGPQEI